MWPEGKKVWRLLKKLKIDVPYNPAILILGVYPKEMNSLSPKDTCTPKYTVELFTIAKTWKQLLHTLTNEQIQKMWYVCRWNIIQLLKRRKILPFVTTWIGLEDTMLSEVSQRKINTIYFYLYV